MEKLSPVSLSGLVYDKSGSAHWAEFCTDDPSAWKTTSDAAKLREEYGLRIRDASHIYGGYNDLNDFLRGKQSGQSEHQQQKPEPEKGQRQEEQPKKKNKGIRM